MPAYKQDDMSRNILPRVFIHSNLSKTHRVRPQKATSLFEIIAVIDTVMWLKLQFEYIVASRDRIFPSSISYYTWKQQSMNLFTPTIKSQRIQSRQLCRLFLACYLFQVPEHIKEQCPLFLVSCPYFGMGCEEKVCTWFSGYSYTLLKHVNQFSYCNTVTRLDGSLGLDMWYKKNAVDVSRSENRFHLLRGNILCTYQC